MMCKLKARLSQKCPGCYKEVFARRLEGRDFNDRGSRVLIWGCPSCERLWRESRLAKPKFKQHGVEQNE